MQINTHTYIIKLSVHAINLHIHNKLTTTQLILEEKTRIRSVYMLTIILENMKISFPIFMKILKKKGSKGAYPFLLQEFTIHFIIIAAFIHLLE